MELIDDPRPGQNAPEFTVTELSGQVKRTVEGAFGQVRVRGEIGRVSRPRSGHLYFDLKDDRAVLAAVSWKGQALRLATQPEEGMEVVAEGRLTTFPGQSRYQLVVEQLRVAGVGALLDMLEKRKKALAAEGLFAVERKRPLPFLPDVIGVVTSPSGAVIRDILHRLRDRFPRRVVVWPVAVQGDACAPQVAAALRGFSALEPGGAVPRPDVVIVARGGGSIEDLWGFNEEIVARATAESTIPVISAVGHETDTTLVDFVSDCRAPTPTAAAEMAVPMRADLAARAADLEARRQRALRAGLDRRSERLRDLARALPRPEEVLSVQAQRLDMLAARLPAALRSATRAARGRLANAGAGLRPGVLIRALDARGDGLRATGARLDRGLATQRYRKADTLLSCSRRLTPPLLTRARSRDRDRLARALGGFARAARTGQDQKRQRLGALGRVLASLGYGATLARGYAVVRDIKGKVLSDSASARGAGAVEIQFRDGRVTLGDPGAQSPAPDATPVPKAAKSRKPAGKSDRDDGGQGSLF
ncbi:MAG: exodeoxyribonuclease VII large subunit [Pseudomonadota bacterium]